MATRSSTVDGAVHVSGYLDMSLDDAIARFVASDIDLVLTQTLREVLAVADPPEKVSVHASEPERFASASARVPVSWTIRISDGRASDHSHDQ